MKWIEVIEFRSFNTDDALLELDFGNQLAKATTEVNIEAIRIYNHSTLNTDVSIHVQHNSAQVERQGSPLGVRLVSELKAFGVVNHTVWVEAQAVAKSP